MKKIDEVLQWCDDRLGPDGYTYEEVAVVENSQSVTFMHITHQFSFTKPEYQVLFELTFGNQFNQNSCLH